MNASEHLGTFTWFNSFRANFYAFAPSETYFEHVSQVPNIAALAIPMMVLMSIAEAIVLKLTNRDDNWRLHEAVLNYSSGGMTEAFTNFLFRGLEFTAYIWVYNNYSLTYLDWDSVYTYFVALMGVEFGYYWWHRASHETSLMWAAHYSHHSAEDYNMTVAARISFTMRPFKWLFFTPLAFLGLPPPIFLMHMQLSFIYAGWTHNETVPKLSKVIPGLGHVLEYIFTTPSHHRVHHGANKYCIDKNYGQTFIIFDRLFGTFAEEREDEPIVYGTISQHDDHSALFINISPWINLWQKVQSMTTFGDKMRALFYGPGWFPNTPRLGNPDEIPDVRGRKKIELHLPTWLSTYLLINSALIFFSYLDMMGRINEIGTWLPLLNFLYIFFGYTAQGGLYEGRSYGPMLELARIMLFFGMNYQYQMFSTAAITEGVSWVNLISLLLWPAVTFVTFRRAKESTATKEKAT